MGVALAVEEEHVWLCPQRGKRCQDRRGLPKGEEPRDIGKRHRGRPVRNLQDLQVRKRNGDRRRIGDVPVARLDVAVIDPHRNPNGAVVERIDERHTRRQLPLDGPSLSRCDVPGVVRRDLHGSRIAKIGP